MKWMEVIKLRVAVENPSAADQAFNRLIAEFVNNGSLKDIKLYHSAQLVNDTCIHIHWASARPEAQGSASGLCLAHLLKDFGLVSHSVWIEEE